MGKFKYFNIHIFNNNVYNLYVVKICKWASLNILTFIYLKYVKDRIYLLTDELLTN
jgi:hypothetical protein